MHAACTLWSSPRRCLGGCFVPEPGGNGAGDEAKVGDEVTVGDEMTAATAGDEATAEVADGALAEMEGASSSSDTLHAAASAAASVTVSATITLCAAHLGWKKTGGG